MISRLDFDFTIRFLVRTSFGFFLVPLHEGTSTGNSMSSIQTGQGAGSGDGSQADEVYPTSNTGLPSSGTTCRSNL